jgi:hypothetical protein
VPVAHNFELAYPLVGWANRTVAGPVFGSELSVRQLDPSAKLRGWEELGAFVNRQREQLGPGNFILCEDYQTTSEMAFYVRGQPKTYYLGSWLRDRAKRHSQYDLWPDRSLDPRENPDLVGKDAVYVGWFKPELQEAFAAVEELPLLDIERRGIKIRSFRVFRCTGFRGMQRPEGGRKY